MTTRKELVIAETKTTHHHTETRRRKEWTTRNGLTAEVLIRTETSKDNPGDNKRAVEITTPDGDNRYRSHEGEEVTDDTMQERDDEIKARESRAAHRQRKEKYGELGDERDDDDTRTIQRFARDQFGEEDAQNWTEDQAIERVRDQATEVLEQNPIKTLRFIRGVHMRHLLTN